MSLALEEHRHAATSLTPARTALLSVQAYFALGLLVLPSIIFCLTWIKPIFGVPVAALGTWTLLSFGPSVSWRPADGRAVDEMAGRYLLCFAAACLWTICASGGHLLYGNWDWLTRDAVLRDLTLSAWPIAYPGDPPLLLRAPLGFYLLPALAGKLLGVGAADYVMAGEMILALFLLFSMMTERARDLGHCGSIILVFMIFSGMDAVGEVLRIAYESTKAHHLQIPQVLFYSQWLHIQWWADLFQYSAHSTMMYWVPNHALPGWLGAALWWRRRDDPRILLLFPFVIAAALAWSPLSATGLVPLMAFSAWQHRSAWRRCLTAHVLLTPPALAISAALYYSMSSGHVLHGFLFLQVPAFTFVARYIPFIVLEYGLLLFAAWRLKPEPVLILVAALLLLLPLYRVGISNDFVMRDSIPAIAILCFAVTERLTAEAPDERRRAAYRALVAFLAIGAVVPALETARAFYKPAWHFSAACTVADAWREQLGLPTGNAGLPPTYFAAADSPAVLRILQQPKPVAPSPVMGGSCWPDYPHRSEDLAAGIRF